MSPRSSFDIGPYVLLTGHNVRKKGLAVGLEVARGGDGLPPDGHRANVAKREYVRNLGAVERASIAELYQAPDGLARSLQAEGYPPGLREAPTRGLVVFTEDATSGGHMAGAAECRSDKRTASAVGRPRRSAP